MNRCPALLAVLAAVLLASGCDGGSDVSDASSSVDAATSDSGAFDAGPGTTDAGPGALDASVAPVPDCARSTFMHGGVMRAYILCVPSPMPAGPLPVVLGFHGGGGNAMRWMDSLSWHRIAAREGFAFVYMQGCRRGAADCSTEGGIFLWNVSKPGEADVIDDQGYTLAVLDRLSSAHGLSIDAARRFATGHSLGGIFAYSMRCDHPEVFAAIGPVSAPPSDGTCTPSGSTSIYHVHGDADANVPFETGCCSADQQDAAHADYLPGCAALPLCANPANWWPPVLSGGHPYASVAGLTEMVTAPASLACGATREPSPDRTECEQYTGCRAGTFAEICMVAGVDHSLNALEASFGVAEHLWTRFAAH